jgi:hypothetical protein
MLDFEKEEFLQRLDIRINAISNLIMGLEYDLIADLPIKDRKNAYKEIDKFHDLVRQQMYDLDRKAQERFEFIKECDNETH